MQPYLTATKNSIQAAMEPQARREFSSELK
jgi:hypothetical protein